MTGTTPVVHSNPTSTEHQAALDTIFAAELKRRDAEAANTARALEGWRTKYRAERARVVGTDLQTRLDEYAARYKTAGLQDGDGMAAAARAEEARKQRLDSFSFAHDLGVNWAGLAALHEAASRELRDILMPRRTTPTLGDVQLPDSGGTEPQPVPAPGQGPVTRGRTSLMAPTPSAVTFGPIWSK
jgi:hypothetical protein